VSILLAMCLFSFSMSVSPGPVNLVSLTTGVNYGFWRALPFVSGATIGFTLLLVMVGLGVGKFASQSPIFMTILAYGGTVFICYMGYKIAASTGPLKVKSASSPSFLQGFALQWLNPKAWIASLSGVTAFNVSTADSSLVIFASLYFLVCYPSIALWALAGEKINKLLADEGNLRLFNRVMGGILVLVALYLFYLQLVGQ
jgi:threonine/homoserine/homoserine lactone efflux protein